MTTCVLEPNGKKSTRQDHNPLHERDRLKETTEERDRPEAKTVPRDMCITIVHKKTEGRGLTVFLPASLSCALVSPQPNTGVVTKGLGTPLGSSCIVLC